MFSTATTFASKTGRRAGPNSARRCVTRFAGVSAKLQLPQRCSLWLEWGPVCICNDTQRSCRAKELDVRLCCGACPRGGALASRGRGQSGGSHFLLCQELEAGRGPNPPNGRKTRRHGTPQKTKQTPPVPPRLACE